MAIATVGSRRRVLGTAAALLAAGAGEVTDVAAGERGRQIVREAKKQLDAIAVYGGHGERGSDGRHQFDCSGLTAFAVKRAIGVTIPYGLPDQARPGRCMSRRGTKPGDLMCFEEGDTFSHVATDMGRDNIIHAINPDLDVKISNLREFRMKRGPVRRVTWRRGSACAPPGSCARLPPRLLSAAGFPGAPSGDEIQVGTGWRGSDPPAPGPSSPRAITVTRPAVVPASERSQYARSAG